MPPHLDADVCLATYLSVQTLERERRSVVMRPALREQERRLRLFLRRKEEARRTWGWSSGSSPAPCALNGTILVTAAGQSTSTSSAASTRPSSASTCRSRRSCRARAPDVKEWCGRPARPVSRCAHQPHAQRSASRYSSCLPRPRARLVTDARPPPRGRRKGPRRPRRAGGRAARRDALARRVHDHPGEARRAVQVRRRGAVR